MLLRLSFILCFVYHVFSEEEDLPYVDLKLGRVIGMVGELPSGREYDMYHGIPYGRVPGRFLPPVPTDPFTEDFIADTKKICVQFEARFSDKSKGEEDCLSLDVFRHSEPTVEGLLPVMVHIHGGAFVAGSSDIGEGHLMDAKEIVIVSITYRLGVFGFLSTGDSSCPGNFGMLDQSLALQWVHDNIEAFGGNPNQVTIFGVSAGGGSVMHHILSPLSAGLFHGVLAMSGTALCPWAIDSRPLNTAKRVAEFVNCPPTDDTEDLVECLRNADLTQLALASDPLWYELSPVVEPSCSGQFLVEHPYTLMSEGRFNKVPVTIGATLDEFVTFYLHFDLSKYFQVSKEEFYDTKLMEFMTSFLDEGFVETVKDEIIAGANLYYENVDFDNITEVDIVSNQFGADIMFHSGIDMSIKFLVKQGLPVYNYIFEYISDIIPLTYITGKPDVSHGLDMLYMCDILSVFGGEYPPEDLEFISVYVGMLTNFAAEGNPTPSGPIIWKPVVSGDDVEFMRLGRDMEMGKNAFPERLEMWDALLTKFMKYQIEMYKDM